MRKFLFPLIVVLFSIPEPAEAANLTGRVIDQDSLPLEGVNVQLAGSNLSALTDADGYYQFGQITSINSYKKINGSRLSITGSNLHITVTNDVQDISIEIFNIQGKRAASIIKKTLRTGEHSFDINHLMTGHSSNLNLIRVKAGKEQSVFRRVSFNGRYSLVKSVLQREFLTLKKSTASAIDSIHAFKTGYQNAVVPLESLDGVINDIVLQAGIAFEPYFAGTGNVFDLLTGDSVFIPMEKRLHVIVFPEGYTAQDHGDGRYENDLQKWLSDVFTLRVPDFYREAFVIWKYPVPSNEHLTGDGTVDSYFKLPLSGGSMASSGYEQAESITWNLIGKFPFKPTEFGYPLNAKNLVCSYMLYNPSSQRSGYSGQARSFQNPANTSQRVSVAMALGQQHEFMHAMARLSDEYYEKSHSPLSSSTLIQESRRITNVVYNQVCETLPWNHLLYGGEYNPGVDSLFGAFGANGRYHPTLKCLMNGSHDNSELFGGYSNLRTNTKMCNWCEEICAFRIYERVSVLPDQSTSWQTWVSNYRSQYYEQFIFEVPQVVPQTNSLGTPVFFPCSLTIVAQQ